MSLEILRKIITFKPNFEVKLHNLDAIIVRNALHDFDLISYFCTEDRHQYFIISKAYSIEEMKNISDKDKSEDNSDFGKKRLSVILGMIYKIADSNGILTVDGDYNFGMQYIKIKLIDKDGNYRQDLIDYYNKRKDFYGNKILDEFKSTMWTII